MQGKWIRRALTLLVAVLLIAGVVYAMRPVPLMVDAALVTRGALAVTVDEDGIARIRDVFQVSAPVSGKLERTPVRVGDAVERNATPVALIQPVDPPFLDVRSRKELEAVVGAAQAGVNLAEAQLRSARATLRLAESDMDRANRLSTAGTISERAFDTAETSLDLARAQVEQAGATLALRISELVSAEARLIEPDKPPFAPPTESLEVRSPVDGVVLKVNTESEQVVPAGTPLVEIGDPVNMEVIVDLLSSDGVAIEPGASATLTDWGGPGMLRAQVVRVDPAAYTKVSALGIEEQRVDAVLDILDDPEAWKGLGHEFRVMVHIAVWQEDDVLTVPMGALFRRGEDWSVFRIDGGTAEAVIVEIGHRNATHAEVLSGLEESDRVVLHPNDNIDDGVRVAEREDGA